jgi:hypothetical protein
VGARKRAQKAKRHAARKAKQRTSNAKRRPHEPAKTSKVEEFIDGALGTVIDKVIDKIVFN